MEATLIEQIVLLRKRKGMTQEQAAAEIGIARQTLHMIESGKYSPRISQLQLIAKAFGATLTVSFTA